MKKISILSLLVFSLISCKEKEVELSDIDILTGGKEKQWEFIEFSVNGGDALDPECDYDNTILFSKGNTDSTYNGPYYKHLKNTIRCSDVGGKVDADEYFRISILPNSQILLGEMQSEETGGGGNKWDIIELTQNEVLLHQTTQGSFRVMHLKTLKSKSDSTSLR